MVSAVQLTQELIRFETINPPGNETPCARYLGGILEAAGFRTRYVPLGENRDNLMAWIGEARRNFRFASRGIPMWCRSAPRPGASRPSEAKSRTAGFMAAAAAT